MGNCCTSRFLDASEEAALDGVKRFTLGELRRATHNFKESISEGGSGIVYIGRVDEDTLSPLATKMQVAVKKHSRNNRTGQGGREWLEERTYLAQLRHPNIVSLVGFCCDDGEYMLIYKYMTNRSMERLLFKDRDRLEWKLRLKALLGAARGLAHLHYQTPYVVYRDLKPSKILLDQDYNGVLADFGVAAIDGHAGNASHFIGRTLGTFGYVCPYYIVTGALTKKADVYSVGVVLLEVLSGRAILDQSRPPGEQHLISWASPDFERGEFPDGFLDTEIEECPKEMLVRLRELARRCLQFLPRNRPSMDEVVVELSW